MVWRSIVPAFAAYIMLAGVAVSERNYVAAAIFLWIGNIHLAVRERNLARHNAHSRAPRIVRVSLLLVTNAVTAYMLFYVH